MNKKYAVIKDGVVNNVILWDKELHPSYGVDGETIDLPTLTKSALDESGNVRQDESGNDILVSWQPREGDLYVNEEFQQVPGKQIPDPLPWYALPEDH